MTVEQAIQIAVLFETLLPQSVSPEAWELLNEADTLIRSLSPDFQRQVVGTIQTEIQKFK